jgi:hypothetical protein
MASEREIVAFLRERHRPAAIVVVGSRADGLARPGCDWDLYLLLEGRPDLVAPAGSPKRSGASAAHRSWFEVLHDRWSQSVHRALPEIERSDPEFHGLLETLAGDAPRDARIEAAAALFAILFGEDAGEPPSPPRP